MEEKEYINNIDNERADIVCTKLSDKSRAFITSLFEKNLILINGKVVKKSSKLKLGDKILMTFPDEELPDLTPKNIPFEIIVDKKNYAIINKPAGLTVHPSPGHANDTLVNALLYTFIIEDNNSNFRPGIVHRLDKDTSGLMIIAKNTEYKTKLSELFSSRKVIKKYYAICYGKPLFLEKRVEKPIARDKYNRQKMAIREDGKMAVSEFKVIEKYKNAFLSEVTIFTGRTHQIRVHAASMGHALIGDTLYGGKELFGFKRQALHSSFLEFIEPYTNNTVSVSLQLPADMLSLQDKLRRE